MLVMFELRLVGQSPLPRGKYWSGRFVGPLSLFVFPSSNAAKPEISRSCSSFISSSMPSRPPVACWTRTTPPLPPTRANAVTNATIARKTPKSLFISSPSVSAPTPRRPGRRAYWVLRSWNANSRFYIDRSPAIRLADAGVDREVHAPETVAHDARSYRLEPAPDARLRREPHGVEAGGEGDPVAALVVRPCSADDPAVPGEDEHDVLRGLAARLPGRADRRDRAAGHEAAQAARARRRARRRNGDEGGQSGENAHLSTGYARSGRRNGAGVAAGPVRPSVLPGRYGVSLLIRVDQLPSAARE